MAYMVMPVYNLDKAVGQSQPNLPDDVRLIQVMLTEFAKVHPGWAPPLPLSVDGTFSNRLTQWILGFQKECNNGTPGLVVADGKINPMQMSGKFDWISEIGSRRSTLFMLNMGLHKKARSVHAGLGARLGLKSSAEHAF